MDISLLQAGTDGRGGGGGGPIITADHLSRDKINDDTWEGGLNG